MRTIVIMAALLVLRAVLAPTEEVAASPSDRELDPELEEGAPEAREPAPSVPAPSTAGDRELEAPSIGEVLESAYRAAGLERNVGRGWSRRARLTGLVPTVTVRTGRNTSWQDLDPEVDRGTTIEVRASWRLDRLVFDGRELQVASMEAARRRERRQLASRVIRAYFHWRRLAAAARREPRWASRAAEATAELDALTEGWFSVQGMRHRRSGARP